MEYQIVHFLNHLGQGTVIDNISFYISWIPFLIVFWLALALIILIFNKTNGKRIFWGMLLTVVIYFILNDLFLKQTLANFYFRARPYIAYPATILSSGELFSDSSFWSGHMTLNIALLTFLVYFFRKWWFFTVAIFFIILMAFSRMHNGMHYPSDVLAGTILGIGYGYLSIFLINKIKKRWS